MYTSNFFREDREPLVRDLIARHGFATLIAHTPAGLHATQLPLLLVPGGNPHGALAGHMARRNPQWEDTSEGSEVLAIFAGPHSYISPRCYIVEPDVPTWNYQTVQVRGIWRLQHDRARALEHLEALVDKYEAQLPPPAWKLSSLAAGLLEGLYRGVMPFEIEIRRIDCACKLSQDKNGQDRSRVTDWLAGLEEAGARQTAAAMRSYYATL